LHPRERGPPALAHPDNPTKLALADACPPATDLRYSSSGSLASPVRHPERSGPGKAEPALFSCGVIDLASESR